MVLASMLFLARCCALIYFKNKKSTYATIEKSVNCIPTNKNPLSHLYKTFKFTYTR